MQPPRIQLWLVLSAATIAPTFGIVSSHKTRPSALGHNPAGVEDSVIEAINLKCSVGRSAFADNVPPKLARFLPSCVRHVRELVEDVDGSYTDAQLQTVLQHDCQQAVHFPLSYDDGFEKARHCSEYACLLVSARGAELYDGSTFAYKRACEMYWEFNNGSPPPAVSASKPASRLTPMFDKSTMPPVSTALWCVINLTLQYFALFTSLAVVRTLISFGADLVGIQQILETGCTSVTFAPMLCVLFLGVRMRAIQLSQGKTEKYNLPQPWVQTSMIFTSFAAVAQVALVLLVGIISGASKVTTDKEGNLDMSAMNEDVHPLALKCFSIARYVVMAMLYIGFTVVVIGAFTMEAPRDIWGDRIVPMSPAMLCTILLSGLFFLIYLLVAITKTCFELSARLRSSQVLMKLEASATTAKMTVNFAPMLCILMIGTRMRALQIDPENGNVQSWARKAMFMCTISVLVQALLVILLPFVAKGHCRRGAFEGDVAFTMDNPGVGAVMTVVRYICLLALYGGIATVVYSVFVIEHPEGPKETPPVSPAMQCVINLTVQYFFIYVMLFICITLKSFSTGSSLSNANDEESALERDSNFSRVMSKGIAIFDAARGTVMFAPMLAILFIGARMRALQLAKAKDGTIPPEAGPQTWVQDCMFLATWAVCMQLIMTLLVPLFTGAQKPVVDNDGNLKAPPDSPKALVICMEVVRYISLIFMYGGATGVVVGIFLMTPDLLPPYNEQALVPGVEVPKPPVPASAHTL